MIFYLFLFLACACDSHGSKSLVCNPYSGKCDCKPNVTGTKCNQCKQGFWDFGSKIGCKKCKCDDIGCIDGSCNFKTGDCNCKTGIGGRNCDTCLEDYFGYSDEGCKSKLIPFFNRRNSNQIFKIF